MGMEWQYVFLFVFYMRGTFVDVPTLPLPHKKMSNLRCWLIFVDKINQAKRVVYVMYPMSCCLVES